MKYTYLILFFLLCSCDDIIEVEDISDKTISILAPTDNSVLTSTAVTFSWNALEDAETYHLQVASPAFENAAQIVLDTVISTHNFSKTLDLGDFEWRVRGENSGYQTSYSTQSFRIE